MNINEIFVKKKNERGRASQVVMAIDVRVTKAWEKKAQIKLMYTKKNTRFFSFSIHWGVHDRTVVNFIKSQCKAYENIPTFHRIKCKI